jgi:sec-independent protein translocase protein TatA
MAGNPRGPQRRSTDVRRTGERQPRRGCGTVRRQSRAFSSFSLKAPIAVLIPLKRTDMIGDLFDSPWKILIVVVVLIVLFGSAKLPVAARSLGKSMRILKTEMKSFHEDGTESESESATPVPAGAPQLLTSQQPVAAQQLAAQQAQQQIDDLQRQLADLKVPAEGQPVAQRAQQPG